MSGAEVTERIEALCGRFRLPTVANEAVPRFRAAHQGAALETLVEVLELEAGDRDQRRKRARLTPYARAREGRGGSFLLRMPGLL